jgi:hypothetical protein
MQFFFAAAVLAAVHGLGVASLAIRQESPYVGYLISTFSDPTPQVQWHLSDGLDASSFRFLNNGQPVLESTVGMRGVRDIFLTTNTARSEYFIIATGRRL